MTRMRGDDRQPRAMFSYVSAEERVPQDHPLRAIRTFVDEILREIRRQNALSIACHPHHRTTRRIEISTCFLWDHRDELAELVDVWEAANRDDLFSVTSLKHFPYVANSDFHKPKHLYSWKTLVRAEKPLSGYADCWGCAYPDCRFLMRVFLL